MKQAAPPLPEIELDWLYARVKQDEEGCLIWDGYTSKHGQPQARIDYRLFLVRRVVWALAHEREPAPKLWIGVRCKKHGCVHPDCLVGRSRSKAMKGNVLPLAVRARISASRCKNSKFSDEAVAAMRTEAGTLEEVAERHGANPSYVSQLRRGIVRREYASPLAMMAAQLGGR